jgi:pyruvate,water dikinase
VDHRLDVVPLAVALRDAAEEQLFGGKAASLGAALRAGLPVPGGLALSAPLVDHIAAGDADAVRMVEEHASLPTARLAARSSAIGEDSGDASFAGQHATILNVGRREIGGAVNAIWQSARSESALAYRARKGIAGGPAIGVVLQALVEPVAAGVLFTRNPLTGADERLIEASWGLGEAVVSGLVVPDTYRLDAHGRVLERTPGRKDVKIWYDGEHGTSETPVPEHLHQALCLDDEHLARLHALATLCRLTWRGDLDLEWALAADGSIYLLQSRPITTSRPPTA